MKITVAQRVIGGFSFICVLLLAISVSSIFNLYRVGSATEEVNTLALPTVAGSSSLKASFMTMGRVTFEAYLTEDQASLGQKSDSLKASQDAFEQAFSALSKKVSAERDLTASLAQVKTGFDAYNANVDILFQNHKTYLQLYNDINDKLMDIEDNADDAATNLLDFADLDEVQSNSSLREAAEIGSTLESNLSTLVTVVNDFIKTDSLVRAQTVGNEVDLVVTQVREKMAAMMNAAGGNDDSGTLDDISELVDTALSSVTASDGIVNLHKNRLENRNKAQQALSQSEDNAEQAINELEKLLSLANKKASELETEVNSNISSGTTQVIFVAIASLAIAGWIMFKTVIAITRPLSKVNELLTVASSGDLTRKLEDSAQDEFGQLARNINKLIDSLKVLIDGINSRADQLAAAAEETSAVTSQATESIQEQKSQIGQVAAATTQMHSTSQLVSQNAEDTLAQIKHADEEAKKVRSISTTNRDTIEVLAKDVEEAAQVINKLHQDSASIGSILDVIRGVADQTNLLALNAAIEAARAGEQGRGFAVVADEVRTLASRTQESTQEINAMIEVLQAGAEKAVTVMNQGKETTITCVEQSEQATQALDLITDAVHRAYDVSAQIEQSAREQNVVSEEISRKLEGIVSIAEDTTQGAHQTSESSHEVARLADELQQSIRTFKV